MLASLDGDYGKGKWCPDGDASKCLDVTAVGKLMATSRDPEELKRAWIGWHAVGAPMRQRYARMVELGNEGSRELGIRGRGRVVALELRYAARRIRQGDGSAVGASCGRCMNRCMLTCADN